MKLILSSLVFIGLHLKSYALENDSLVLSENFIEEQIQYFNHYSDSVENTFTYTTGKINLKGDFASINVPEGFKFLNGDDSERILTDLWGNPPSEKGYESLGMIVPDNFSPFKDSIFSINITYSNEGYIEDDDAKDLDYDELLSQMQEDCKNSNAERVKLGYPTINLIGWASTPFYDEVNKKLHWAKEFKFGDDDENTLNYNIRILGRKGYLELNAIGEMSVLNDVKNNIDPILNSVNFTSGNTYSDFDPDIDEVAAYGIGGLIAGKLLMKAGILAKLGVLLAKFWKVIVFGVIGIGAVAAKFFKKGNSKTTPKKA